MADGTVEPLLDVTNTEAFDYRWCPGQAGKDAAYAELVPMAGGRSDIYQATDTAAGPGPQLTLACLLLRVECFLALPVPFL